jgi:hypothetical protein
MRVGWGGVFFANGLIALECIERGQKKLESSRNGTVREGGTDRAGMCRTEYRVRLLF